ncbi:ubiquitin-conjugating enzyme/RWD-like protein [Limtongia smithiae]|uniref:ubiquitin-conjugating enzyme/RWD-like protein n=1 Tax=Limtongia smithiae TaxID=1125753 RepID=UPI0034CE8034
MNSTNIRILKELLDIQRSTDHSIFVYFDESNIRSVRALILGPTDTCYSLGMFEFTMKFPKEYPTNSPAVLAITTNGGRTRFNPNIYASGNVCLSILGTWRGEAGEQWSSAQGIESVLLSVQSLMGPNPFENEPGYEHTSNTKQQYVKEEKSYIDKIRHETIRITVLQRLEGYLNIRPSAVKAPTSETTSDRPEASSSDLANEPFEDLCKRLFRYYYSAYKRTIESQKGNVEDGTKFAIMPFEFGGNKMEGKFMYGDLEKRLDAVRDALNAEAERWIIEGREAVESGMGIAASMQLQYEQISRSFQAKYEGTVSIELIDDNPFAWRIVYIGRPMTSLDGGLFRVRMIMSPRFPDEQPRMVFETPIYHINVTADGVPFFRAAKAEDPKSHIEGLINLLESSDISPDPRTWMNLDAATLYFGTPEQKREYKKSFRRAVQRSSEY